MLTNFKFNIPELDIEAMEKCKIRLDNFFMCYFVLFGVI